MRAVSVGVRGVVACHRQRTRALGNPLVGSLDHRLQLHIAHSRVRRSRTDSYDPGVQLATAAAFLGKRCQMRAPPTGRGLRDPRSRGREGRHATDAQHSQHIYICIISLFVSPSGPSRARPQIGGGTSGCSFRRGGAKLDARGCNEKIGSFGKDERRAELYVSSRCRPMVFLCARGRRHKLFDLALFTLTSVKESSSSERN